MTTIPIKFNDRDWTLSDEAPQCSYGEPVLIADDGTQFRGSEIAIPSEYDDIFGVMRDPVSAMAVVSYGRPDTFSDDEWPAAKALLDRFARQYDQFYPGPRDGLVR